MRSIWEASSRSIPSGRSEHANKQTNKQRPFAEGPEDDVRDGGIDLFTDFCPSYHKKLNNLDYLNMKLDYLKGTRPMRPMCIRNFFLENNI